MIIRSAILSVTLMLALSLNDVTPAHHSPTVYNRDQLVVIEGFVSDEMDGFPHWQIKVRTEGKDYNVDLGSEYILREAGLHEDGRDFRIGDRIQVEGYLPVNPTILRIVPLRIHLKGKVYELKNHEF